MDERMARLLTPTSPGPVQGQSPSPSYRDGRRARKRSSLSAESGVRCALLFSRTTNARYY